MEYLTELWALVESVWEAGAYGIGGGNLIGAFGVFLFFAVLRGLFTRFVLGALNRYASRTKTDMDDLLLEALERPLKFFFLILGAFFGVEFLSLEGLPEELADKGLRTLIAIGIFWSIHAAVHPLSSLLERANDLLSKEIINWLLTVIRIGIVLTGAATILQTWGIEIAPIIAGFGLFGVAVALGAQDLFKNLLGGLSILVEGRFKLGDWVKVEGVAEGTVEHIGFRSTRLRQFNQVAVTVPNNMFADHAVVNFSTMNHRRIYWKIGLEYRTTVEQMKQVVNRLDAWLSAHDGFVTDDRAVQHIYIDSFNDSSIDMMVYCFTVTTDWEEWLGLKQELAFAIKNIVEEVGTGFAFPSTSLYIENLPGDQAEIFVPPEKD
ncbi:MAG: mechanosensitive ion channel family protein [Parvibaculales bacterium]